MASRFLLARTVLVLMLFIALVSCDVSGRTSSGPGADNEIHGFNGNLALDGVSGGTISGGGQTAFPNQILLDLGAIGGGRGNQAGNLSTVAGGEFNIAEGLRATIGGGGNNTSSANSSVVAGGYSNTASQVYATVGGGSFNKATGMFTTVSGGSGNLAEGRIATVGGGTRNRAESAYTTIGGGLLNIAIGGTSTIAGGTRNQTPGVGSTVGGGAGNVAAGLESVIAGGLSNTVTDNYGFVAGGRQNIAGNGTESTEDAPYASVGGGYGNQAEGAYATVPGGDHNQALGDYSFAAGSQAQVAPEHAGTFLFADSSDFAFPSSAENEFAVRATGGVRFVTALDGNGEPMVGVRLSPGSGSWETLSDRDVKTDILPVDSRQVLETLMRVPVSTWRYIGQPQAVEHIGPMAQDFYAAFGMGEDEHYIGAVDADGVALAAIQGLYQVVQEKEAQIADQEQRLHALEERLANLEQGAVPSSAHTNGLWWVIGSLVLGLLLGRYGSKKTTRDERS